MNLDLIAARATGWWSGLQDRMLKVSAWRWLPVSLAGAFMVLIAVLVVAFAPVSISSLRWGVPLAITGCSISWALFWPMDCATWFGWIGMLFRMIAALILSTFVWTFVGIFL